MIKLAPTGIIPTKEMTPFVPISESEIVEDVFAAWEIGINMVHIHARDSKTDKTSNDIEIYGNIIEGIRSFAPDLIISISLSGRVFKEFKDRAAPLELKGRLKPDMGSLTLSSLNFNKQASINEPEIIQRLAFKMKEKQIKPELEAFDAGMINYSKYLMKKRLISAPHCFNLILGNIACAQADILHTGVMLNDLPDQSLWCLGGVGSSQLLMNSLAIAMGGGVRVGLEDNIWYDKKRTKLASNLDLIRRIHIIAEANERKLMSPSELRRELNLEKGTDGRYGLRID